MKIIRTFLSTFFALVLLPVFAHADIQVTVTGPGGSAAQSLPEAGGGFDVNLPLKKNSINKLTITAKDGNGQEVKKEVNVTQLSFENLAVASLKTEPLPPARIQELVNSGVIKLDDPSNFNVSVFTIVLTIGTVPVPIQIPIAVPKAAPPEGSEEIRPASDPGPGNSGKQPDYPPTIVVFNVTPSIPGVEAPSIPGVIVIEGRIKTLKEFFSAKFLLMNTSGIFTLSDVQAQIEFPDGGLSPTLPADGIAALGDILPGSGDLPGQALKEFIFRGDEKGIKKLKVSFGGKVSGAGIPEGEEVPFNGSAETTVEVKGPPSFLVRLTHPDYVYFQQPYEFGVEITNSGDTPALYTSLDFDVGADASIIDCKLAEGATDPVCVDTEDAVTRNFGHIYPGQTVKETFLINPKVEGPVTSCMGISDQNIDLQVTVGNIGCITGKVSPPSGVPTGVPTVSVLPFANALGISPNSPVVLLFSELMNKATITTGQSGSVNVYDKGGNLVPGRLRFSLLNGRDIAIWQVDDGILNRFRENEEYSVVVKNTIKDLQGTSLFSIWDSKFTTSGEGLNDFTPPTISLGLEPPLNANNIYPGQKVRVNAFVADQGSAVQKVELRSDDLSVPGVEFKLLDQKNVLTGDKPPFFFLIDSKNLVPGHTYQLRGTAYDFAGNTQDAFLSIIISSSAPTPDVFFDASALQVLKGVPLQITPSEVMGGAFEVNYFLDGNPLQLVNVLPYSVSVPTLNLSIGIHTLNAVARDGLNQTGIGSKDFTVLANNNAPQITFDSPSDNQLIIPGSQLSVKANIEDPTGLQSIKWYFNDPNSAPFATGVTQFAINTSGIPIGTYKLYVKATNNIGLSNDVNAAGSFRTIQINNPPPAPPPAAPSVNSTPPSNGFTTVSGVTEPNRKVDIKNTTKSITVTVFSNASGNFTGQIEADPGDNIEVVAYDPGGTTAGGGSTSPVSALPAVVSLDVTPATLNFTSFNSTANLTTTATRADSSNQNVTSTATYSTSNGAVASVNAAGKVVALGNGTATITASFEGVTDTVAVNVSVRVLNFLSITPSLVTFTGIGQNSQLSVIGNFSDNTTEDLTSVASYVTGNPNIALVNGGGLVSAISGGATSISVSRPGIVPVSIPVQVNLADGISPTATIDSPTIGTSFERGQVISLQVTGNDSTSGVRKFTVSASGGFTYSETKQVTPVVGNSTQTFSIFVPTNVALPGNVDLNVQVEDAAGNVSTLASRSFALVDATAPTVTIISPSQGTPFNSGDTITLQVSASDAVGVTQIRYTAEGSFSGSSSQNFVAAPGAQSGTFNISVPFGVVNPELILKGFAKDAAGNESSTAPLTLNITSADITPPATQATAITAPSGTTATVTYVVTDGLSDLDHVELFFRRNGIGTYNRYSNADVGNAQGKFNPQSGNTGTIIFDSTKMGGDGAYEFYTVGVDAAGNKEAPPTSGANVIPDKSATFAAGTIVTTISANTAIAAGDTSFDNKNLKITGAITVTLDGSHTFQNVELLNGAKLVHSETTESQVFGLDISVWSLSISSTSSIDVNGRGYLGGARPGNPGASGKTLGNVAGANNGSGGSYGGPGGVYDGATNALYGNLTDPFDLGSGGGARGGFFGGDGGGKVRVSAINIAADGNIVANGTGGQGNASGDGSGGSINFAVTSLSGNGLVTANGGADQAGGGGGRIGVTYVDLSTKDKTKIRALGGLGGYKAGGNGTVFLRDLSQSNGDLVFDGQSGVNSFTVLPIPNGFVFDNITLRNNARVIIDQPLTVTNTFKVEANSIVSHSTASEAGLKITAKNIAVDTTSSIDVNGRGYLGGCVGGNSGNNALGDTLGFVDGPSSGCGGSYGGDTTCYDGSKAPLYGNPKDPKALGSGGGCRGGFFGGNGGGFVDLTATDTVDIDGVVKSDGSGGQGNASGDGSGGTVRISTVVLKGQGSITANGGSDQAGGGGGRVLVRYSYIPAGADGLNDTLNIKARGGRGVYKTGAPGTVVLKRNDQQNGDLYIDDDRAANASTETELTPIGFGKVVAVTPNALTMDATYPQIPGGLVGLQIRPNVNSSELYTITANTATVLTVDTTSKPALTSVTSVGATYAGSFAFDNVYTRRGGTLRLSDKLVVANTVSISDFGRLTHREASLTPTTFGRIAPRIDIVSQNFIVSANSSVNVVGRGYPGGSSADSNGFGASGLSAGFSPATSSSQGGNHGGLGARYASEPENSPSDLFDSVTDPTDFGGGGGSRGGFFGGDGGGIFTLQASNIQVDGIVNADGSGGQGNASGDGAGGTVNIRSLAIAGSGTIRSSGGANQSGGGGGRIAIRYGSTFGLSANQVFAKGGIGVYSQGGAGTVFIKGQSQVNGDLRIEGTGASTPFDLAVMPVGVTFDNILFTNNAKIVVNSTINSTQSVQITNGSLLTHAVGDEAGIQINTPSMFVDSTSVIDVSGRGYRGGANSGNPDSRGETLGKQLIFSGAAAGSYGGIGGTYDGGTPQTQVYGSVFEPIYLGAGGGSRGGYYGGNGGGRISLNISGTLNVQGILRANGTGAQGNAAGDGAGGSIFVQAGTVQGTGGVIEANGGGSQAAGGGGRIYVGYGSIVPTDFSSLRSIGAFGGRGAYRTGSAGTVLLKANSQGYGDLVVDNDNAQGGSNTETQLTPLGSGFISNISGSTFTVDGGVLLIPGGLVGLKVKPNANNSTTFLITGNDETTVTVDDSSVSLSSVASVGNKYALAYTFDNLTLRGKAILRLFDPINVLGSTTITEGSTLTHPDISSSLYVPVVDLFTGSFALSAGSAVNVDGRGYMGGCTPGNANARGLTSGFALGSTNRSGGSYGGLGAIYSGQGTPNPIYGNPNNPFDLGSGGGCAGGYYGGDGGGAIRLVSSSAVINGLISAGGGAGQGNVSGDGSGGSINLTFGSLSGSGIVKAQGGSSQAGGGGGRVFISASTNTLPAANITAPAGVGVYATGQPGTVVIQ